jgi:hypothetical protein
MTIGDFMHGLGLTQEVYELRIDVGLHARRVLEKAQGREYELVRLLNGKRAEIRALKGRIDDLAALNQLVKDGRASWRKGVNPGTLLSKLTGRLRNERIRLQNDPEYIEAEAALKEARVVITRAQTNARLTPHEDKSLKDGGRIRRW